MSGICSSLDLPTARTIPIKTGTVYWHNGSENRKCHPLLLNLILPLASTPNNKANEHNAMLSTENLLKKKIHNYKNCCK
jgi:hypothetical protein